MNTQMPDPVVPPSHTPIIDPPPGDTPSDVPPIQDPPGGGAEPVEEPPPMTMTH